MGEKHLLLFSVVTITSVLGKGGKPNEGVWELGSILDPQGLV